MVGETYVHNVLVAGRTELTSSALFKAATHVLNARTLFQRGASQAIVQVVVHGLARVKTVLKRCETLDDLDGSLDRVFDVPLVDLELIV